MMDNSFDILPAVPDDPLELLQKIVDRQKVLISESEVILKKINLENYGEEDLDLKEVIKENNEESDKQISDGLV